MASIEQIIEAEMKQHDAKIKQLAALKQMVANDPSMVEMMRKLISAASNGTSTQTPYVPSRQPERKSAPNGLSAAVLEAAKVLKHNFTTIDVVKHLVATGFEFVSNNPRVAVAAPLERMIEKEQVKVAKRGLGNLPNLYDYIGE